MGGFLPVVALTERYACGKDKRGQLPPLFRFSRYRITAACRLSPLRLTAACWLARAWEIIWSSCGKWAVGTGLAPVTGMVRVDACFRRSQNIQTSRGVS